jgi:hypothetical protein
MVGAHSARQTLAERGSNIYTTRLTATLGNDEVEVVAEMPGLDESLEAAAALMMRERESRGLPPVVERKAHWWRRS